MNCIELPPLLDYEGHRNVLLKVINRAGEATQYVYNELLARRPHYLTEIIDARGVSVLETQFDESTGQLTQLTDAADNAAGFTYKTDLGDGRYLEVVTDAKDVPTELVRDANGNIIRRIQRLTDDANAANRVYQITVYRYDDPYDPELQTHASVPFEVTGDALKYDYLPDPITWQSVFAYDLTGNVRSTTDALGNTTYFSSYDSFGNPRAITDPLGNVTQNTYNSTGNLTQTTDAEGNITKFQYDSYGNLDKVIQIDDAGNPVTISDNDYDAQGRLTNVEDAAGLERHFVYDVLGNQTVSYYHWDNGVDDYRTIITRTDYDSEGRVVGNSQHEISGANAAAGHKYIESTSEDVNKFYVYNTGSSGATTETTITADWTTTTQYNAAGQVEKTVDRLGNETWNFYDARGLLIETLTHSEDTAANPDAEKWLITRTVYDDNGRVIYATDPQQATYTAIDPTDYTPATLSATYGTHTIYDDLGRVTKTEHISGLVIGLADANSDGIFESSESGTHTVLSYSKTAYDDAGRVEHTISSDDSDPPIDGPRTDYYYDAAGRQIAVLGPEVLADVDDDGDEETVRLLTEYTYDAAGRQTQVATNIAVTDLTDDRPAVTDATFRDNASKVDGSEVQTTYYEYDGVGRQTAVISTEITDPETTHVRTETVYDALGRRVMVRENITQDDPFLASTIDDTDVRETCYEYDDSGRLTAVVLPEVEHPDAGINEVHPRYEYSYDVYGNQTSIRDNVYQIGSNIYYEHGGTANDFTDDYDTRVTKFTCDAYGRQLTRQLPIGVAESSGFTETSEYDDLGRLELSTDFEDRVTKFVYDSFGRLEQKQYWSSTSSYTSNPNDPEEVVTYTYDAFGRVKDTLQDADGDLVQTTNDQRLVENTVLYKKDEKGEGRRL